MLGEPFAESSGCGRQTVRVTPKGDVIPCVYWHASDLRVEELPATGSEGVLASPQFARVRTIPEVCGGCAFVAAGPGGCARRAGLAGGGRGPAPYWPPRGGGPRGRRWGPPPRGDVVW